MTENNVMVVDDEEMCVEALLEDMPWSRCGIQHVYGAFSSRQARELLTGKNITILICDIEMPGESGLDLVQWVTEWKNFRNIPMECIMLTCHPEYEYTRKALQMGCLDYLLKPVDLEDLEQVLLRAVKRIMQQDTSAAAGAEMEDKKDGDMVRGRIIPYIEEHLTGAFSVTDIASEVGLNPQYMMRLFKKATGMSILDYVVDRRVALAKDMLVRTDWSLDVISENIGYLTATYFIKVFKRSEGLTPGEYRKKYR